MCGDSTNRTELFVIISMFPDFSVPLIRLNNGLADTERARGAGGNEKASEEGDAPRGDLNKKHSSTVPLLVAPPLLPKPLAILPSPKAASSAAAAAAAVPAAAPSPTAAEPEANEDHQARYLCDTFWGTVGYGSSVHDRS